MARETVDTSEIRVGDLVLNYGMRIRIDEIQVHDDSTSHGGIVYCCYGMVLNVREAIDVYDIPRSFMFNEIRHVHGAGHPGAREDFWNVQGNDLARWTVERRETAGMRVREHRGFGHGLRPGTDRDINCGSCQAEQAAGQAPVIRVEA